MTNITSILNQVSYSEITAMTVTITVSFTLCPQASWTLIVKLYTPTERPSILNTIDSPDHQSSA